MALPFFILRYLQYGIQPTPCLKSAYFLKVLTFKKQLRPGAVIDRLVG